MTRALVLASATAGAAFLVSTAIATPPQTPPGLEKVCDQYAAEEPSGAEVSEVALESGRRGVPCDLTAENGICLLGQASVTTAPGGALSTVPVVRDLPLEPGQKGSLGVATLGHFIDDWQGETAYLTVGGATTTLTAADVETDFVFEVEKTADGAGGILRTYVNGNLTSEAQQDQKTVSALDGNPSLLVATGTGTDANGANITTWKVLLDRGDDGMTTLSTISLNYTPNTVSFGSCWDGIQNGDEGGVDCGGSACTPCLTQ